MLIEMKGEQDINTSIHSFMFDPMINTMVCFRRAAAGEAGQRVVVVQPPLHGLGGVGQVPPQAVHGVVQVQVQADGETSASRGPHLSSSHQSGVRDVQCQAPARHCLPPLPSVDLQEPSTVGGKTAPAG